MCRLDPAEAPSVPVDSAGSKSHLLLASPSVAAAAAQGLSCTAAQTAPDRQHSQRAIHRGIRLGALVCKSIAAAGEYSAMRRCGGESSSLSSTPVHVRLRTLATVIPVSRCSLRRLPRPSPDFAPASEREK